MSRRAAKAAEKVQSKGKKRARDEDSEELNPEESDDQVEEVKKESSEEDETEGPRINTKVKSGKGSGSEQRGREGSVKAGKHTLSSEAKKVEKTPANKKKEETKATSRKESVVSERFAHTSKKERK